MSSYQSKTTIRIILSKIFLVWLLPSCQQKLPDPNQTLWYEYPATYWNSQAKLEEF